MLRSRWPNTKASKSFMGSRTAVRVAVEVPIAVRDAASPTPTLSLSRVGDKDEVCDKMKPPHKASAFEAQLKRVNLSITMAARGHTTRIDIAPYRRHVHHPAQSRSDEKRQERGHGRKGALSSSTPSESLLVAAPVARVPYRRRSRRRVPLHSVVELRVGHRPTQLVAGALQ